MERYTIWKGPHALEVTIDKIVKKPQSVKGMQLHNLKKSLQLTTLFRVIAQPLPAHKDDNSDRTFYASSQREAHNIVAVIRAAWQNMERRTDLQKMHTSRTVGQS